MENLSIPPTDTTPAIDFNQDTHVLKLAGESYPGNVMRFFQPVMEWLEEFLDAGKDRSITVRFEFTMFNSSTAKVLLDIIDKLNDAASNEDMISIVWQYHEINDLIEEFGMDLQDDYPNINLILEPISE